MLYLIASRPPACQQRGSGSLPPATRPKRSKKETAAVAAANEEEDLIDKRVRVFWPEEKQYFSGRVAAFDKEKARDVKRKRMYVVLIIQVAGICTAHCLFTLWLRHLF